MYEGFESTRMHVDIGAALGDVAEPGVDEDELEALDEQVAAAREAIAAGRENSEFGYAALNLPEETDPSVIRETVEPVTDAEYVLTVGIGGSALGAATLSSALRPSVVPRDGRQSEPSTDQPASATLDVSWDRPRNRRVYIHQILVLMSKRTSVVGITRRSTGRGPLGMTDAQEVAA